jgi:hypothetical protein
MREYSVFWARPLVQWEVISKASLSAMFLLNSPVEFGVALFCGCAKPKTPHQPKADGEQKPA